VINKNKLKIAVLGDAIIDIYLYCDANRIAPEGPFPVLKVNEKKKQVGGSLNVALNCLTLGAEVTPLIINSNKEDRILIEEVFHKKDNFHSDLTFNHCTKCSYKYRAIAYQKIVSRYDIEETTAISDELQDDIYKKFSRLEFDIVILSDYNKGTLTDELIKKIISFSNKKNIPILIDPKKRNNLMVYKNATLLTPNLPEAKMLIGQEQSNKIKIIEILSKLKDLYNVKFPLITLGEEGIALLKDEKLEIKQSKNAEVFDVTGAGDTVIATLGFCLAKNICIEESIKLANFAASETIKHLGTYSIKYEDLKKSFDNESDANNSMKNNNLDAFIFESRKSNKKIVFTNGCFDLIHYGHINYLKEAKELGDILIVGLNTDESISRLKGSTRPVKEFKSRLAVLESIKFVDLVIPFKENTPIDLIKKIKPDILVKGGDYTIDEIIGKEYAKKTKVIPLIKDFSTTSIIKNMKK